MFCLGWIESVPDDVHTARCKKCNILLPAHYQQLKSHALCPVHVSNSASLQTITGLVFFYIFQHF